MDETAGPANPSPAAANDSRSSQRLYRCVAIVLSRMDLGEADRILTLYSREHGKLRVIAKGVRRPLSRLGPHLDYFCRTSVMLARGRELDVVTGAETEDAYLGIRADLEALGHASHLAEMLSRLTEDRQENRAVFDLLANSLRLLADGVDPFHVTRHYEIALLALLGFRPELYQCVECGAKLPQAPHLLAVASGGFLCQGCRGRDPGGRIVSVEAQRYLRALDRGGLSATVRLQVDDSLRAELEGALAAYIRQVAERELGSLRVLREMREGVFDAG